MLWGTVSIHLTYCYTCCVCVRCLTIVQLCERLAYYGLTGSLPIFFHKHLGLNNNLAAELNNAFTSLSYLTPLIGAYVADKYLGRFSTYVLLFVLPAVKPAMT